MDVRPVTVTTVLLVRVNVTAPPAEKRAASVPAKVKSVATIVPALNPLPLERVKVTDVVVEAVT